MSRRAVSPTEMVVNFFMRGSPAEVEQALLVATAIVAARKQPGGTVPTRRARTPRPAPASTAAITTVAPGPVPVPLSPIQQEAAARSPRRRSRPPTGPVGPKRTRRTRAQMTAAAAAATASPAAGTTAPSPLPPQGTRDRDDEPLPE